MRNLHQFILENYGIESLRLLRDWERFQLRQRDYKHQRIFTLRCLHNDLVPVSIKLKSTLKSERAKKILRMAEKQLLQTRLKSINSLLDNNAKQLELTRSKIASILTTPNYQQCQEFIEKIKEKRFNKVKERQVRKLNNLINKKEGGITWHSSQVFLATRAFPQANNRLVTLATRALQAANNSQTGRLIPRASPQASQGDSTLPLSTISQVGNPQALQVAGTSLADSTLSQAESVISQAGSTWPSQAGSSQSSPGESALSQAESKISQAGSSQASLEENTLSLAESGISQVGSPQASPVDNTLSLAESVISQAGSSQDSPVDNTLSQSETSQAGSSQSSLVDSTLPLAESVVPPQAVRHSARLRASQASNSQAGNSPRQAGITPRVDSAVSQPDSDVPLVASSQASASQEARSSPPNRHSTPQGSFPLEEPNPKWVINLSSKPLTPAQRSVLAKDPNFAVSLRHPPNLEYITAIQAACTKLSQQDAEELRANINWVLRASHPHKPNLTKAQNLAIRELKKDRDCIVLTADKGVSMVIMDRQDYISKANNLLSQNTYRSIQWDPTNTIKNKLINILKKVKSQTGLSNQTYKAMYPTGCVPPSSMVYPRSTSQIPH